MVRARLLALAGACWRFSAWLLTPICPRACTVAIVTRKFVQSLQLSEKWMRGVAPLMAAVVKLQVATSPSHYLIE